MPNPKARAVSVEAEAAEEDLVAVDSVAADLVVAAVAEEVAVEDLVVAAVAAEVAVEDLADAAVAGEAAVEDLEVRQFYGCNVVLFIKKSICLILMFCTSGGRGGGGFGAKPQGKKIKFDD